jgi:hypothetical protein
MTVIASLVAMGGVVAMAAVEFATVGASLRALLAWRFAVALPTLAALALLWHEQGASLWPLVAYCLVQPWMFRRWINRRTGHAGTPVSTG